MLSVDSAISEAVIAARGYATLAGIEGLDKLRALGFIYRNHIPVFRRVNLPGLLIPCHSVDGQEPYAVFRPDAPNVDRTTGKARTYEVPPGTRLRLDVPPLCRAQLGDATIRLYLTGGPRQSDALASKGACAIALPSLWSWRYPEVDGDTGVCPDFDRIAWSHARHGPREVYLCPDSHGASTPQMRAALEALRAALTGRGAHVRLVVLPSTNGERVTIDAYLAAGHRLQDLEALLESPGPQATEPPTDAPAGLFQDWTPELACSLLLENPETASRAFWVRDSTLALLGHVRPGKQPWQAVLAKAAGVGHFGPHLTALVNEWIANHPGDYPLGLNALNALNASTDAAADDASSGLNALNSFNAFTWPELHPAALRGVAGDTVRLIDPHTEADPVALLGQFLCAFGVAIGHRPFYYVDGTDHHMNLFLVLVGQTSKARKGTAAGYIRRLFDFPVDPDAVGIDANTEADSLPIVHGLSSGEGLIWQVRDAITKQEPIKEKGRVVDYQEVLADAGVSDKRLLILEAEFSRVLRVMERESNTLSATLREAWDSGRLRIMTKNHPAQATGAHIGIIGHITAEELQRGLTETEAANGFGNRFIWVCVRRSKMLPEGGAIDEVDFYNLKRRVREALRFAREVTEITRSDEARELWNTHAYPLLTTEKPGLLGSIIGRAEAQVLRISCLYALIDCSTIVERGHLEAALALWQYAEQSAIYLFGQRLGDPLGDELLHLLRQAPEGLSRTDISNALGRNRLSHEIGAALGRLLARHLVRMGSVLTEGAKRPTEMWFTTSASLYGGSNVTNLTSLIRINDEAYDDSMPCKRRESTNFIDPAYELNPREPGDEDDDGGAEPIGEASVPF
jgi:hypothetical protein